MSFRVVFSTGAAAKDLWAFGEDQLAYATTEIPDEAMLQLWERAAVLYRESFPLPVEGRRITLGHVVAFTCMERIEGGIRPLARARRRPASHLPEDLAAYLAHSEGLLSELWTRLVHGEDGRM